MDAGIRDWLMQGEPWLRHMVLESECMANDASRAATAADPAIRGLVASVSAWPWPPLNSHKAVGHPLHQLCFLADLGISASDLGLEPLFDAILASQPEKGPLRLPMAIPQRYGGSGEPGMAWALCDAPLLTWALIRLGRADEGRVRSSAVELNRLGRENGWPCITGEELGGFRGPGRKSDPCPYANLIMLQLNSAFSPCHDSEATRRGLASALRLWGASRQEHPYMFYMGTDFRRLKAPLAWYDIMHVADVLSAFPRARADEMMSDIVSTVTSQADGRGRYTAGSVWQRWSGWEFSQKKEPSRYLTLRANLIKERMGQG
jgi:hypothetical protein